MINIFEKFNSYQIKASEGKVNMIWTLLLSGLLINLVGVLAMPQTAQASRTPLSTEELEESSCCIVVGKVKSLSSPEVNVEWGPFLEVTAIVEVISIEKGLGKRTLENPADSFTESSEEFKPGDNIKIFYRQRNIRGGTGGFIGQNNDLPLDANVKLFLILDYQQRFQLLDPNGWEAIPSR